MAPRPRTPASPLHLLDLPPLTLNHLVQLADFAALDHGGPDLQHGSGTGAKSLS
jgi:hypothetical protein